MTGRARHGSVCRCRSTANAARSGEVNATSPSMPAVLRPALCCVTRRTLTSVFDRLRSISFCRLRTRFRSPSCDALKIRCRSRRTSSSTGRHQIASQSRSSSRGPFTESAPNLPASTGVTIVVSPKAHLAHVSTLRGPAFARIRPVIHAAVRRTTAQPGVGFPLPFGHRHWLLGPSCSRPGTPPPSRSAHRTTSPDPDGVSTFHMHKTRPGRVPPISRGTAVFPRPVKCPGRRLPLHSGQPCTPVPQPIHPGLTLDETSSAVHSRSPVRPSPHL